MCEFLKLPYVKFSDRIFTKKLFNSILLNPMIEARYYLPQIKTGKINTRNSDIITNSPRQVFGDKPITIVLCV